MIEFVLAIVCTMTVIVLAIVGYFYMMKQVDAIDKNHLKKLENVVDQVNTVDSDLYNLDSDNKKTLSDSIMDLKTIDANAINNLSNQLNVDMQAVRRTEAENMMTIANDLAGLKSGTTTSVESLDHKITNIQSKWGTIDGNNSLQFGTGVENKSCRLYSISYDS